MTKMDPSITTYLEQENLRNENRRLRTEAEQLIQNLLRLEFGSPPSLEASLPAPAEGKRFVYILEEVHVQQSRDNEQANHYKLGITDQNPNKIVATFQNGNPRNLNLKRCEVVSSDEEVERRLKWHMKEWQLSARGGGWYLVPHSQRSLFYGKFYGALKPFGVEEPNDIPKGWLQYASPEQDEDRVWIASGGVLYHINSQCSTLLKKGRKVYPIYKTRIQAHNRRACRQCVQEITARPVSLSFSEELLQKISY